jgi:hypothetical protein
VSWQRQLCGRRSEEASARMRWRWRDGASVALRGAKDQVFEEMLPSRAPLAPCEGGWEERVLQLGLLRTADYWAGRGVVVVVPVAGAAGATVTGAAGVTAMGALAAGGVAGAAWGAVPLIDAFCLLPIV